ncbi:MAG: DUF72 domain-containing protein [Methanomicrobiales archaeon]|nr:DUF72 domain-containing protein [Methanomicrobiales archaeon]
MESYVGTSGWAYGWNEGGNLAWYIERAGLPAVELNASFYRFPFPNQIAGWARRGATLRWCVKVHRLITHRHRMNEAAREVWQRFLALFRPLDPRVEFYLLQLPPRFTDIARILSFLEGAPSGEKIAVELRGRAVLEDDAFCQRVQERAVLVSVDSPEVKARIFPADVVYLRLHGRTGWYSHDYTEAELRQVAEALAGSGAEKALVFFNNDHHMLENARRMREILGEY